MPESTSSQASTPNPQNGVNKSESQWNQEHSPDNAVAHGMVVEWNELENYGIVPVSETRNVIAEQQIPNSVTNGLNQQVVFDSSSYMNVSYHRSSVSNGYNLMNASRRLTPHLPNGPNFIRAPNGQIIGGHNWPIQTPLARYISQSPGWTPPSKPTGVKKQKRIRTAFTSQQMMELEQEYARTRYLDRARRIELSEILRLNERTIKIWFQNRRMKEKKDRAESLEDSEEASTTESSPEVSNSIQVPMLMQEQYQSAANEVYNHGGIYIEQYPVSSTSTIMPSNNLPTSTTEGLNYDMYMTEEQCHSQYQHVHLQMQQYPSPYSSEVQELSPDLAPPPEDPVVNAPSDIIERSWDLSWIKSIQTEDDY